MFECKSLVFFIRLIGNQQHMIKVDYCDYSSFAELSRGFLYLSFTLIYNNNSSNYMTDYLESHPLTTKNNTTKSLKDRM